MIEALQAAWDTVLSFYSAHVAVTGGILFVFGLAKLYFGFLIAKLVAFVLGMPWGLLIGGLAGAASGAGSIAAGAVGAILGGLLTGAIALMIFLYALPAAIGVIVYVAALPFARPHMDAFVAHLVSAFAGIVAFRVVSAISNLLIQLGTALLGSWLVTTQGARLYFYFVHDFSGFHWRFLGDYAVTLFAVMGVLFLSGALYQAGLVRRRKAAGLPAELSMEDFLSDDDAPDQAPPDSDDEAAPIAATEPDRLLQPPSIPVPIGAGRSLPGPWDKPARGIARAAQPPGARPVPGGRLDLGGRAGPSRRS